MQPLQAKSKPVFRNALLFTLALILLLTPITSVKNAQMEMLLSKYIAEHMDAVVFQHGFAEPEKTKVLLEKEFENMERLGWDMGGFSKANIAALKAPATLQENQTVEFKMIQYMLQQPEMEEVTNFSINEERCMILRRFVSSLPFSNPDFQDPNFIREITSKYDPVSYREMTLKIINNKDLFSESDNAKIQNDLRKLLTAKKTFHTLVQRLNLENVPIYVGDSQAIRAASLEKLKSFVKTKNRIIKKFSEEQAKVRDLMDRALQIADDILENHQELELKVQKYNQTVMFEGMANTAKSPECMLEDEFLQDQLNVLGDLSQRVNEYSAHVQKYMQYSQIKDYMESAKNEMKQAYKAASTLEAAQKKQVEKYKTYIIAQTKKLKDKLFKELTKNPTYLEFLSTLELYKDTIIDLTVHYDMLTAINRRIERLNFLIEEDELFEGGDIVIGASVMIALEKEINHIESMPTNFNEFSNFTKKQAEMGKIKVAITQRRDYDSDRLKILKKAKTLLEAIDDLEIKMDVLLALVFAKSMMITNSTGQSENRMLCFDEVDLGHVIMNMVKTNMILNIDLFMEMLTKKWDYVTVKRFALRNYFILTSANYQGQSLVAFSEKKFMGASEESQMRKKLVEDYSMRIGFFTGLYRQKVEEIDFTKGRGFFNKVGLFFSSIIKQIWNFLLRSAKHMVLGKIVDWIMEKIADIIPFIGAINILYRFLKSLLFVLIEEIFDFLKERFYTQLMDLRTSWGRMLRKINNMLGTREIRSTDVNEFFISNDAWMSWKSSCWQYDFCYEEPTPQALLEPMETKEVFYLDSLQEVEKKYVKHLQIQKEVRERFQAINYVRMINQFRGDNYLLSAERLQKDPNLLVTACLYYKGKLNLKTIGGMRRLMMRN